MHRKHCLRWARAPRPSPEALPWMGSCPPLSMVSWVDSSSPPDFHDFCPHKPRMKIGGISTPPGRFVARVCASIVTAEGCTSRGSNSPAADTVVASVFSMHIEGGTGPAEALAAATTIAHPTPLLRSSTQETDSTATTGSIKSVSALLGTPALPSATTRRRTATAIGNAPPLHIMDSGPAGPLDHLAGVSTPPRVQRPRPIPSTAATPPLRSPRYRPRLSVTARNLLALQYDDLRPLLVTRQLHPQS